MDIKKTDKHLGDDLYIAYSVSKKNRALSTAILINRAIDLFRDYIDFPRDIKIRVAPLKGNLNGRCYDTGLIEISSRLYRGPNCKKVLEVLAHELVHAEQYKQGRLKYTGNNHKWNGVKTTNKGTTYQAYRNLPWEQEAWSRQSELADKVIEDLKRIYG